MEAKGGRERGEGMSEAVVWSHQERASEVRAAMQWSRSSGAVVVVPSPLHGRSLPIPLPSTAAPLFVRSFFATRLGLFQKCPFPHSLSLLFFPWTKMNAAIRGLICAPPVSSVDRSAAATNGTRHSRRGHLGGARALIVGKFARRRFLCSHRK